LLRNIKKGKTKILLKKSINLHKHRRLSARIRCRTIKQQATLKTHSLKAKKLKFKMLSHKSKKHLKMKSINFQILQVMLRKTRKFLLLLLKLFNLKLQQ